MGEHRPATRNNGDENRERHETLRPPHGTVLTMLFMAASPLLAVKGSKPHLNTHNARYQPTARNAVVLNTAVQIAAHWRCSR